MFRSLRGKFLEEFALITGLISMQVIFAVYAVFMSHLMSIGLSPFFLIIYGSFSTSLFLFPLSICFERHKWPGTFSRKLFGQFVLISFGGVTLFQVLMLTGVKKTSPAIASAMPNLAPGLIFIIAWVLRFEKVNLKCVYSRVKIAGTLVCIVGAIAMSFLHGSRTSSVSTQSSETIIGNDKIMGSLCLLGAVSVLSCIIVLQAATLGDFPAPMSLCAITSFIGAILTTIVQLIQEHRMEIGLPFVSARALVGYALLAGVLSGACTSFQAWAVKKKGPVLVSMFSPIGTVCSVILSALTLGDPITLGSMIGMLLMFGGLYFVLWAKKKEDCVIEEEDDTRKTYDAEKPLLS